MELALDASLGNRIRKSIQIVSGFPRPKVNFRDITPIIESDPALFRTIVDAMAQAFRTRPPDCIVCIESWGYVFGAPLAYLIQSRLCVARRAGKLPRATIRQDYDMCYAEGLALEIHSTAIRSGETVLIVDDVVASGGSALAAVKLANQVGARCVGVTCVAAFEGGTFTQQIEKMGIPVHALARL
jgi:adenine phosphoribosyltransferase